MVRETHVWKEGILGKNVIENNDKKWKIWNALFRVWEINFSLKILF